MLLPRNFLYQMLYHNLQLHITVSKILIYKQQLVQCINQLWFRNDKPNITNITQPSPAIWASQAGSLNKTINCDDAQALADAQSLFPLTSKCTFNLTKVRGTFVSSVNCPLKGIYKYMDFYG